MKRTSTYIGSLVIFGLLIAAANGFTRDFSSSSVGAGGYDVVAYHTQGAATRGTGWHVAEHEGTTYLFASKENRKLFVNNPGMYLPQYGGYCAFGVAMGKKFHADPTVWKIVDGKLYLNLDTEIQKKFVGDLASNIEKADANWPDLRGRDPSGL